jgi:hypothetical protein
VVPAVLALVGLLVSVYFGLAPRSASQGDPLASCQRRFPATQDAPLNATTVNSAETGVSPQFEGCAWPPLAGTDRSGHWTVRVLAFQIPGSYAAERFTTAEVFDTSCQALALDYQFVSQGTSVHERVGGGGRPRLYVYVGQPPPQNK